MAFLAIKLATGGTMYVDETKMLKTTDGPKLASALQVGEAIAVTPDCSITSEIISINPA